MEKYSSWLRGAPAKGVGRVTGAGVRVSPSPPKKSVLTEDGFFYIFIVHGAYNQIFAENPVSDRRIAAQSDENVLMKKTKYRSTSLKKRLTSQLEV